MERLFGTDGVRGIPGKWPLLPETVRAIARAAAENLLKSAPHVNGTWPKVIMGRDTRGSGPTLARDLKAGLAAAGCRTVDLGVIPTPGVSCLVPRTGALCGVVISASHNPPEFNGIKFFSSDGSKMDEAGEKAVEAAVAAGRFGAPARGAAKPPAPAPGEGPGLVSLYADFLKSTFPATLDLEGLRVVVDCANGASAAYAPALLESLGAEVFPLGVKPDGTNINRGCGAIETGAMRAEVRRRKAHCGISFDGDADRAVFADERGSLLDGDSLICLAALRLRKVGLLKGSGVVLTVMSNFGLVRFLERSGVRVVSVPVGDRNVSDALVREGYVLGGENSGHIVFRSFAPTGDGMLTALQTLAALRESGGPLSALRSIFHPVPQVLKNLTVRERVPLEGLPGLQAALKRCEAELKGEGRVFLRYSGTEPLLRILVEGPGEARVKGMAEKLARAYLDETHAAARLTTEDLE